MPTELTPEIKALCERASQENDPQKLLELTERINQLISEQDQQKKTGSSRDAA
jgi:hypothetical protein